MIWRLLRFNSPSVYTPLVFFPKNYHRISKTDRRVFMMSKFGPPINRGMRELDRSFFHKDVSLLVAVFPDPKFLGKFVKECKKDVLYLPSIKHIVPVDKNVKGVLLRPEIDDINDYDKHLSEETRRLIKEYSIDIRPYTLKLDYDFWKADDILRAILPQELVDDIPSGFAQAGHVAHLNLREEFKEYGGLIGQIILDKNSKIETVVDKMDTIDTQFRTFKMNVLAGKDDLLVEQSESGCRFKFDFSKVYWNSRLSTEHERLISRFLPGQVVCDVFAGVGPFSVPAGKKNVIVLANDLNPESYKYLKENIGLNRVLDFVRPFNVDGRAFIKESVHELLQWASQQKKIEKRRMVKKRKLDHETTNETTNGTTNESTNETKHQTRSMVEEEILDIEIPPYISHYVMNLPDSALTFLNEFIGLYGDPAVAAQIKALPDFKLPLVNVHCFEKYSPQEQPEPTMEELHKRIYAKIVKLIDFDLPFSSLEFHLVRKVAPTKPMFCVSFQLPEQVVFRRKYPDI